MQTQSGFKMAVTKLVLFILSIIVHKTDGSCSFPSDLRGSWMSSRWGDVTFTSTVMSVTGLADIGNVDFVCEIQDGTIYVMRSTATKTVLGNVVDVVTCLDVNQLSSSKYYYYHRTSEVSFVSGITEPVKLVSPSGAITTTTACDITDPFPGTNHMMIKAGEEAYAGTQCPDIMLATFNNYTYDKGSGVQCGGVGYIDICTELSNITVDYSICSEVIFYSTGGSLECVYSSTNGSTTFVNVYNFDASVDDSTNYRFSCIALEYGSGGYVYASQYPMACDSTQTATSVPSSPYTGATLELAANLTCIPVESSSSDNTGAIVAAVVFLLLLIILVALAIYCLCYRKRWPQLKKKLPCWKGKNAQVDPHMTGDGEDGAADGKPERSDPDRPLSGQPTMVTTAVVSNDPKVASSSSSRSIVTPSKLQTDVPEEEKASTFASAASDGAPVNPAPRRLPPLDQGEVHELPPINADENL